MKCEKCGAETQIQTKTIKANWGHGPLLSMETEADVCVDCGKVYFSAQSKRRIDWLAKQAASILSI